MTDDISLLRSCSSRAKKVSQLVDKLKINWQQFGHELISKAFLQNKNTKSSVLLMCWFQ